MRFLLCVGVEPNLCPPRQPQKNPFVERYHRSFGKECLEVLRLGTKEEVRAVTETYVLHYNREQPNQALSCGNRPPRVAYPDLPMLPALSAEVDPDRWLVQIQGQEFARRVLPNGTIEVDQRSYYIQQTLAGQQVVLVVNAPTLVFEVLLGQTRLKVLPIKGLVGHSLPLEEYVTRMREEARSEHRRWRQQRRWRQASRLRQLSEGSAQQREKRAWEPLLGFEQEGSDTRWGTLGSHGQRRPYREPDSCRVRQLAFHPVPKRPQPRSRIRPLCAVAPVAAPEPDAN